MRILLICYVYPPEVAPAGVMTRELAEDLVAEGHDVTVLTGWPNHPEGRLFPDWSMRWRAVERVGGYRVMRVWHTLPDKKQFVSRIIWFVTFAISSFVNILACQRFDVVYSHTTPIFGPLLTWLTCRLKGMKYVYGIYDIYPEAAAEIGAIPRGKVYNTCRKLDTFVCHNADSIPTLGEGQKATLMARGISGEKIPVIPFWIDAEKVKPLPRDNPWRRENEIDLDKFVVLYAGTIGHLSGAGMMVDVAEAMRDDPSVLFLFVGEGVVKEEVRNRSEQIGLKNMRFLPFQPAERLAEMQATADVSVITLLPGTGKNSIPSKMLGYLAAGRPVVVSVDADSDTAQCIRDGNCGLVVATQDVAGMVQAIKKMMAPGEAVRYGTEARQYFLKHYSRSAGTGRYIRLLREVCGPKKSQTHEGHMGDTKIYISPLGRHIVAARARPVKRAVDFLTAMAALIVVSPILVVSAILVKLTSKGPVFYMGERVGRGGKPYKMIKFRSMKVGAPSQLTKDGKMIVTREDPRVTGIGRLLRASKADELPQFLNVLKGDMSFVGPRSGLPEFEKNYSDLAYERLRIRPGVTGIGSVLGGRHMSNECLYELEARYVEHQNLWLDFLIVLMTPVYILFGRSIPRFVLRRYIKGIEFHMLTGESTET